MISKTDTLLITGAGGFIGSHLTELMLERGYKVRAFVHYNNMNTWGWLETSKYKKEVHVISGNIRDYDSVFNAVKDCQTVFHLAALIGIPYSYVSPLAYIRTNIHGTYNVLQAAKELHTENIVVTSTSETYGTAQYVPIDENHPIVGQSPYSASKIAADNLAVSYYRSFGVPVKIIRPFNVYGSRQSARAIIPTIILQILSGNKAIRIGNIHPTRDLTFVGDTVRAFLEVAKSDNLFGEVVNVGMNKEISIGDLLLLISELMGVNIATEQENQRIRPHDSEVDRLCCDNKKVLKRTNWRPTYNLKKGIAETIEWFKENIEHYKPQIYNL